MAKGREQIKSSEHHADQPSPSSPCTPPSQGVQVSTSCPPTSSGVNQPPLSCSVFPPVIQPSLLVSFPISPSPQIPKPVPSSSEPATPCSVFAPQSPILVAALVPRSEGLQYVYHPVN